MSNFFKTSVTTSLDSEKIRIQNNGFIEFSQKKILVRSEKLNKIKIQYNGLCEIICNYILLEDLLGEENLLPLKADVQPQLLNVDPGFEQLGIKFKENSNFVRNYNKFGDKITPDSLRKVEATHILDVTNFFTRLIAVLFSIYPCNLFSNWPFSTPPYDCKKLPDGTNQICVDKSMLAERFNQLEIGFYIKFMAFEKKGLSMKGHSMLIKKTNEDRYSFFEANEGEYLNLTMDELEEKINSSAQEQNANQLVFLDAKDFVNSYQLDKKSIDTNAATLKM